MPVLAAACDHRADVRFLESMGFAVPVGWSPIRKLRLGNPRPVAVFACIAPKVNNAPKITRVPAFRYIRHTRPDTVTCPQAFPLFP
jgi:hypothetical protein